MNDFDNKNASPSDKDGDGVSVIEHGSRGSRAALFYKVLALILIACLVGYLVNMVMKDVWSGVESTSSEQSASNESVPDKNDISSPSSTADNSSDHTLTARPAKLPPSSNDPNDLSYYVAPGQTPKMEEVIERLHAAGIHSGLGAFNPPGTSPPMIGLAVPDDYVLPEGYVRHYQATDDGQRIEPILMYSPDFAFFDSNGQPIVIPENRVVPGNMAPPGLVIRPIQIPEPLEPGGP